MSYKDILVFLDDGKSNAERVKAAFTLAKIHDARLTGVSLASMKPVHAKVDNDKAIARMAEKLAQKLVDDFNDTAEEAGLVVDTIMIFGDATTSGLKMAHYARNFDLAILSQPNPARDNFTILQEFAKQAMLHSGRPLLFVPYIGANKIPFEHAMIAWDGTPAASRAVHDALPLLARAKDVMILVVTSRKQKEIKKDVLVEGLSYHLRRHDVNTRIVRVDPGTNSVSTVIQNQIADNDIDMLIMGGYGTPSLKQKIFGGVTQKLLSSMLIPVLMSH